MEKSPSSKKHRMDRLLVFIAASANQQIAAPEMFPVQDL
jgi:hypothetical protein